MRVLNLLPSASSDPAAYDELYAQAWGDTLKQCEKTLERHDHERALQVKSIHEFSKELSSLLEEYPDEASKTAIILIYPTLDHYDTFAQNFVAMMMKPVDTSMMWGLLFLVFKLALGSACTGPVSPLNRITEWLRSICRKLSTSNACKECITDFAKIKEDTVEVHKEIIALWLHIIMTFRTEGTFRAGGGDRGTNLTVWVDKNAWDSLSAKYLETYEIINEAVERINLVAEMMEKQARVSHERSIFQRLLSLEVSKPEDITLPCHNLPVAQNGRFYGRKDILKQLDAHLTPTDISTSLSSIALYGLGGIGKTQIALAYAYQKLDDLDAVFWISAEDRLSIQHSFSKVAVDGLRFKTAHPQAYEENMILVLDWLQKTSAKWLLIFDNVDSHDVLDNCWPVSKHGAVLVTTRDFLVATLPIDSGLEVNEFEINEGADFLLLMAHQRRCMDGELDAARQVAKQLGGLPLALNQMAALINARNCSIKGFEAMYAKHARRLHQQKKSGWKYLGYDYALNTVWEMSFTNLGDDARACLGVLSFFSPDSVPSEVFTITDPVSLPNLLSFCEDELSLGDALEELTHHALVRKNLDEGTFRIHRLVQAEYRVRMDNQQDEFEAATKLLLDKFPPQRSIKYDDKEWILYERYIPQVLALAKNYTESQSQPKPLQPTMDFVGLLTNAVNAIHDNDTTNVVAVMLATADSAFHQCPKEKEDRLLWAFLQSLKCMYHFCTSEFARSEREMTESLNIRLELLPHDDLLLAVAYSWLGMAVGAQERYEEGIRYLLKAGEVLEGPAGETRTRKLVWGYNTSRNYYCMGRYDKAETLLTEALAEADRLQSWYMQVYGHLTFTSLRTRMNRLDDAKRHVEIAKKILETSGIAARFSWLSSYCAYRAGDVAKKQGRIQDAIEELERSVAIGKLVRVPTGILSRCTHAYSRALAMDPSRQEESDKQRMEARRLRSQLPDGGGDLDDESSEAFERLVKMDHR